MKINISQILKIINIVYMIVKALEEQGVFADGNYQDKTRERDNESSDKVVV